MTQNALLELERDGFIERRVNKDSVWQHAKTAPKGLIASRSRRCRSSRRLAPRGRRRPRDRHRRRHGNDASFRSREVVNTVRRARSSHPNHSRSNPRPALRSQERRRRRTWNSQRHRRRHPPPTLRQAWPLRAPRSPRPPRFMITRGRSPSPLLSRRGRDLKPIRRRGRRGSLTWPMRLLLGSLLLCGVIVVVARFFPYAYYLPEVEAGLAKSAGQTSQLGRNAREFLSQARLAARQSPPGI